MRTHHTVRIVVILAGLAMMAAPIWLRAGEPPSEKDLARHGMKRVGIVLALVAEAEVHAKAEEVRHLSRELSYAVAQQRSTLSEKEYQDTIKGLTAEINQLKTQANAALQTMNRIPKRRGYPINNILAEEYQELRYFRNQLEMEIGQRQAFVNQLKSKPFDPKDRIRADNEVRTRTEALHQGAQDLRKLVDGVREKYAAAEKDPQVKGWLNTPEGHAGVKPRLGPSRAFLADEKMLERIERAIDEPGAAPPPTASRRGHRTSRVKHPVKSKDSSSPF